MRKREEKIPFGPRFLRLPKIAELGRFRHDVDRAHMISIAEVTEGDSLDPSYAYPLHLHLLIPSLNRSIDCYAAALN